MADKNKAQLETELEEALAKITTLEADNLKLSEDLESHKRDNALKSERIKQLETAEGLRLEEIARLQGEITKLGAPVSRPHDFVEAARETLAADKPAHAGDISEAEISAKVRAGLDRAQAIQVIKAQRSEDVRNKKAS